MEPPKLEVFRVTEGFRRRRIRSTLCMKCMCEQSILPNFSATRPFICRQEALSAFWKVQFAEILTCITQCFLKRWKHRQISLFQVPFTSVAHTHHTLDR